MSKIMVIYSSGHFSTDPYTYNPLSDKETQTG